MTTVLSLGGLIMVVASFLVIHEGPQFPGFWALLPVTGAVAVMVPQGDRVGFSEKILASAPLVIVGRMSYSLYLWHWPVFSLVDYQLFLASEPVRLALKIVLSLVAAYLSFRLIEKPARVFLNQRKSRPIAYAALTAALVVCVPLGIAIRKANYVNAEFSDVANGGLVFPGKPGAPSVVLMGDSNGAMYGKVMKEICADLGYKLTVISVAAGNPLPSSNGRHSQLWLDSLAVLQQEKPDCLVLACRWESSLKDDMTRLPLALESLKPLVKHIVILNQPPILPKIANRANIRLGARPPFVEETGCQELRIAANAFLANLASDQVSLVDIASHFQGNHGDALFLDIHGRQLYQDHTHLSGYGAELIRPVIQAALPAALN